MRINKYIAASTPLSRRQADAAIAAGRVTVNAQCATAGMQVSSDNQVQLDGRAITPRVNTMTILLHKPVGYVCSRAGQGSRTIYSLLPSKYQQLQPVGRLDKDSSGLLILTNNGKLANRLTHPRYGKEKIYQITLHKPLKLIDQHRITAEGIMLEDGISRFLVEPTPPLAHVPVTIRPAVHSTLDTQSNTSRKGRLQQYTVHMHEGRNRQIRRTFAALGYRVTSLHRTQLGMYQLGNLAPGMVKTGDTFTTN
jgi:23S rRNA pseudouridine2605 synthase